jgi:2,4-dienoyl-CoA reductase-like NADH-dependent reductase (Old Yellow Enzyme family)
LHKYPTLFSPIGLRGHEIRNRILSTGHQTYLAQANLPSDAMVGYHEARARGGAGLIIVESARFHESSFTDAPELRIHNDAAIPAYRALAHAVHLHGARIFGQLSHAGRASHRMQGGLRGVTYSPSAVADNRFHTMPRAIPYAMITELTEAVGNAARRYAEAGFDGVELLASHGLLFAQFLNPTVNLRDDAYGGNRENRLRFLCESLAAARRLAGPDIVLGIRISADEVEPDGLTPNEVTAICSELDQQGLLDYVNVTLGSMAGLGGSIHVVPPMQIPTGYVAPQAGNLRAVLSVPVLVAGRINQPQIAEHILSSGLADMCGMTRAMISDPEMANKARLGRAEEIRACIGCNQACIGHFHAGNSISCIQTPQTGREREFTAMPVVTRPRRVLVAGGGPAGMKAAVTAARRGHAVTLCDVGTRLGGQVLLAQTLPGRAEFGGLITNLMQELHETGVEVRLRTRVDAILAGATRAEVVIISTGALSEAPLIEGVADGNVLQASDVIAGRANPGSRVLVADWRCDWVGMGIAELLARKGHHVRLAVNGTHAGQNLQQYLRDHWAGILHGLGVEVLPYVRLFGVDPDSAYLAHIVTGSPVVCDAVDTVVLAALPQPDTALEAELQGLGLPVTFAGDCLSPRSAEEAIFEGFLAGRAV